MSVSGDAPAPPPSRGKPYRGRKGRGAQNKGQERFRRKQNETFHQQLRNDTRQNLGIAQPFLAPLEACIRTLRIFLSFIGLPMLLARTWQHMTASGGTSFNRAVDANPLLRFIFMRVSLKLAHCKLAFAQRQHPGVLGQAYGFTIPYETLDLFRAFATNIPFPLAMYINAIGYFTYESTVAPLIRTGSVLQSLSYDEVQDFCTRQQPRGRAAERQRLNELFGYNDQDWWTINQNGSFIGNAQMQLLWRNDFANDQIQIGELRTLFGTLMKLPGPAGQGSFLTSSSITTGKGTEVQLVRFPDKATNGRISWYCNAKIDTYEKQTASAFLLGYESVDRDSSVPNTRFTSTYEDCYERGTVTRETIVDQIVFSGCAP